MQQRQPAGSADGGQFASGDSKREEVGQVIDLWSMDKGNFYFPPRPRDAGQLIEFWSTVDIPPDVLRAVSKRQEQLREFWSEDAADKAEDEWRKARGIGLTDPLKQHQWDEVNPMRQEVFDKFKATYPMFRQGSVGMSIRAACMYRDAHLLPEEEREKVVNAELRFPDGVTTPKRVWKHYRFGGMQEAMRDPDAILGR